MFEFPQDDVDVGLEEDGAEEVYNSGNVILVVQHMARVVAEYEGRSERVILALKGRNQCIFPPDDEKYPEERDEHVDDIKHLEGLLQEDPGKDDDPDGGAGRDHVDVRHGHVLQTVEDYQEVGGPEH